jgi:hypothetical protein
VGAALQALAAALDDYERAALVIAERPGSAYQVPGPDTPLEFTGVSADLFDAVLDDPTILAGYDGSDAVRRFRLLSELACAVERYPADELPTRFRARAARLRFLVWSLPARLHDQNHGAELFPVPSAVLGHALGRAAALDRARTARQDWLSCLAAADSDPWLTELRARDTRRFDVEHHWLTEQWPGHARSGPLALLSTTPATAENIADHREVAGRVAGLHWLAVGSVLDAARALGPKRWWVRGLPWLLPALAIVVLAALSSWPGPDWARWLAGGVLLAQLVLATVLPSGWDALLLLRLPAAAAIGTAAILALTPRWWVAAHGWLVGAGLAAAAALYLVLESRLHNVTTGAAFSRGLPVAFIGLAYAFLVSLVVFGFAAPAVAEHGQCLIGWWDQSPWQLRALSEQCTKDLGFWPDGVRGVAAAPVGALATLTGWSFAIGIAVQLLWDDQPVTAPLGRLRRRGGTP